MMTPLEIIVLVAIVVMVAFSAFFSSADMVYSTVDTLRLKKDAEKGSKSAALALKFANEYDKTITTILFSNNLVNIAASSLASISYFGDILGPSLITVIMFLIIVTFAEIIPKVIGRVYSHGLAKLYAYPILIFKYLFIPFVYATSALGRLIVSPLYKKAEDEEEAVSDDELQEMVDTIEEEGVIDEEQGELLRSAITFMDTQAYEIMTPRVDIFAFDIEDDISELINDDNVFMYSRVPVYEETIDNIIGILPTKLLLKAMLSNEKIDVRSLLTPVTFVPRSRNISAVLQDFKKTHNHIAIVKDEYGGTEGLITLEDIVEELVGDIWDEMDEIDEEATELGDGVYQIDGAMNIEDFFELVELELDEDADYSTVSGWCVSILERFAKVGDRFTYENLDVKVIQADEFTVEKIRVKVLPRKDVDE
ncbi:MAG TPA: hemolysin family protein [Bacilli bacterium]|nr:hemolysin family protein [Bacilli bacterium]HOR20816.1 hemolysin family protein [Bacilli bacterium]HPK67966.1 hemolysin family protein [Bacilli bacterium]HPV69573.1 hemolysin family protein [Bacilli bacterium]HPY38493.1 hemolysin family protein [Bacilli bacterium]